MSQFNIFRSLQEMSECHIVTVGTNTWVAIAVLVSVLMRQALLFSLDSWESEGAQKRSDSLLLHRVSQQATISPLLYRNARTRHLQTSLVLRKLTRVWGCYLSVWYIFSVVTLFPGISVSPTWLGHTLQGVSIRHVLPSHVLLQF